MFDWVQIWAVGRKIEQLGASGSNGLPDCLIFMVAEIVHHYDVMRLYDRLKELLGPGQKTFAVDWPIEQAGCGHGIAAQKGNKSEHLARPMGHLRGQPLTFGTAAM